MAPDSKDPGRAATAHEGPRGTPARATAAATAKVGPEALIGTTLSGRYRIERLIGEGGMGAVYQAEHTHMRKRMAIKVLHPEMSRMKEVVARFEREAMAAAHIEHPNVANATDFGKLEDGSFFLALEFIEGKSLREVIAEGRLPLSRALHITRQIANGLQRAHALGIVHRDLKPENVMLVEKDGDPDFVKVLDFGIAKVPVGELAQSSNDPAQPVLTQAGMVYGTPEYMAPEQALGQPVDPRADLYALGVMAYEMMCGVRPFDADSKVKLLGMHVTAPVPPMAQTAPDAMVPPEVEQVVTRLLAKEASERTQEAKILIDEIVTASSTLVARGMIEPTAAEMAPPASALLMNTGSQKIAAPPPPPSGPMLNAGEQVPAQGPKIGIFGWKTLLIAAVIGGLGVVALVAILLTVLKDHPQTQTGNVTEAGLAVVGADGAAVSAGPDDDKLKDGIDAVAAGDYGIGVEKLTALEPKLGDNGQLHLALVHAYAATSKPTEALDEAKLALKADPSTAGDQKLRIVVRDASIGKDSANATTAFEILEGAMGTIGFDDLYETAYGASGQYAPAAAARAQRALKRVELRPRMSPALQITLDLRAIGVSCEAKKLFDRAAQYGDGRTLVILRALVPRVSPGGLLGHRDLLACVHDGSLTKTMAAIEARVKDASRDGG